MSGTSLDGIDAVLVDLSQPKPLQIAKYYLPFDDTLKNDLLALHLPAHNELHQAQVIGNQLARMYAAAVAPLLAQAESSSDRSPTRSAATAKPYATVPNTAIPCRSATPHYSPN